MLHLEQLIADISALGQHTVAQHRQQRKACQEVRSWLESAPSPESLRERVAQHPDRDQDCALPATDVPLNRCLTADSAPPPGTTVVAVDGSQIMPDRHAPVLYYLIQTGGMIFRYDGTAPISRRDATLHFRGTELYDAAGQIIGRQLGMRRTVAELAFLAKLTEEAGDTQDVRAPIYALTDGPLLWPYSGRSEEEHALIPDYMEALSNLRESGAVPAGFVERPGGRPLLNLLILASSDDEGRTELPRAALRLTDNALMKVYLASGERTVWLRRLSSMNRQHRRYGHEIWFCYINVGAPGYPVIARIEAPAWAATRESWSTALQAVLLHQSKILQGYPYALARAHEVALVTQEDKATLDHLLRRQLMEAGFPTRPSEKARQKSYLGRRR